MKLKLTINSLTKSLSLFALVVLISASSCRSTSKLPYTSTPSAPYVQLKDGKKYEGTSAQRSTGLFIRDKIELGDTSFKTKDVAFYSTGSSVFANVGRKIMAAQVAAGKINLYKYTSTYTSTSFNGSGGSHTSSHTSIHYYIQNEAGRPVKTLNYNNLLPMVMTNTPEYQMLERYRKTRVVTRSLGYGALGLMVGGAILVGSKSNSTSNIGAAMAGVGFAALWPWLGIYTVNRVKLLKTVLIADKSYKPGKHKRIE